MDDPKLHGQGPPQWLLDLFEESEADAATGHSSPWPEALARLEALSAELDSEQVKRQA